MLVLRRYIGESIMIADNIKIKVINIGDDDSVAIGIDAPKDIPVNREEIYERLKAQGVNHIMEGSND